MRLRVTAALTAAAVLAAIGAASGGPAAASPPAGTVILPPVYGDSIPRTDLLASGAGAFGFSVSRGTALRPTFEYWSSSTRRAVDTGLVATRVTMAGHQAAVLTTNSKGIGTVHLVDLATGAISLAGLGNSQGDTFAETGDGFLIHVSTANGVGYDQLQRIYGSSSWTANMPIQGYIQVFDCAADSHGALVAWAPFDGGDGNFQVSYIDFATKKWTKVGASPNLGAIAMSPGHLAWSTDGNKLHRLSRAALTATPSTRTLPKPVSILAITDTATAWETDSLAGGGDSARLTRVWTLVEGHSAVPLGPDAAEPVALDSDFVVTSGTTVATAGAYRLHPGASSLAERLTLGGPDAPLSVTESAGRFLFQTPTSHPTLTQRRVSAGLSASKPRITLSPSTSLATHGVVGIPPAASGGHTATYECTGANACAVVVRDGATVVARIPLTGVAGLGISGNLLLVARFVDSTGSTSYFSDLYDLNNLGAGPRVVPYTTAVSGTSVAFVTSDGTVTVRDMATPTPVDHVVRPAGMPAGTTQIRPVLARVLLAGDWVLWSIPDDFLEGAETVAARVSDGRSVTLPVPDEVRLVDGAASYIDAADQNVRVVNLATGVITGVGRAEPVTSNRQWLAMSDDVVAFVAPDDTTHLVPLVGAMATGASPRVLGVVKTTASSLVRPLRAQVDASRPLSSWRFTVVNSHGAVVFASHGSAADGGARPTWSGRSTSGARVPDGVYTWRLTGTGTGGALRGVTGAAGGASGVVRLDTVAPHARLVVPGRTGHSSLTVRWSAGEPSVYAITVSLRVKVHGRWTWSAPRTWRRATTATTLVYSGSHVPFPLRAGQQLLFRLVASDRAGNHAAPVQAVTVVH